MDGWILGWVDATLAWQRNDIWSCNEAPCCLAVGWQLLLPNAYQATVSEASSVVKTEIKKKYHSFKGCCKTQGLQTVCSQDHFLCINFNYPAFVTAFFIDRIVSPIQKQVCSRMVDAFFSVFYPLICPE